MKSFIAGLSVVVLVLAAALQGSAQKLKPEEVIAKHLESLGTSEAKAALKNRVASGSVQVKFISQKNQTSEGRVVMASTDAKSFFGMTLNATDYSGEKFVFDGKKAVVGFANNGVRSVLGNFILSNNWIVEESVFGGSLVGTWALLATGKGKLSSGALKKIDGKEVYSVGYSKKGGGDIDVTLYFDKETFRHVRTEYKRTSSAGIGTSPNQSSGFFETRHKVVEDFSNFKDEKGLMLPHTYKVLYSVTGQNGTTEVEWNFEFNEFAFNQNLDEATFSAGN